MLIYTVGSDDHRRRLESFLQRLLPAATSSYLRKLTKSGACLVNHASATSDYLLKSGDELHLKESGSITSYLRGMPAPIDLLWHDSRLLVINKPAGLAMHPAAEVDTNLVDLASNWLDRRSKNTARAYPVNRLDRGTSGVVLLATSSSNAGILGRQVKELGLNKRYLALVEGNLVGSGEIDQELDGKTAVTHFHSLYCNHHYSLLLVEPITGRTHQIRRHLAAVGHPVAGDKRYTAVPLATLPGIALHSFVTTLYHPCASDLLTICAPLPKEFRILVSTGCGLPESALFALLSDVINPYDAIQHLI